MFQNFLRDVVENPCSELTDNDLLELFGNIPQRKFKNLVLQVLLKDSDDKETSEAVSEVVSGFSDDEFSEEEEQKEEPEEEKKDEREYVFTDGSSKGNGKKGCKGGYGVFFGDNDARNISEPLTEKVTNNIAELTAILECSKALLEGRQYYIVSDSEYSINCVTKWCKGWIKNNWMTKSKKPVKNKELIQSILVELDKKDIEFIHVNSHKSAPSDKTSMEYKLWYGNKMADELASECLN